MSPQIEAEKRIAGESGAPGDAGARKAAHRRWLVLAAALIVTAALLASGIWSRVKAGRKLRSRDFAGGSYCGVGCDRQNERLPPRKSSCPEMCNPSSVRRSMRARMGTSRPGTADIGAHVKQGQLACGN